MREMVATTRETECFRSQPPGFLRNPRQTAFSSSTSSSSASPGQGHDAPVGGADRGGSHQFLHRRQVGKRQLQQQHQADADQHRAAAQQTGARQDGSVDVTAVEQIENLAHDQRVHRQGAGLGRGPAVSGFPQKQPQRGEDQQHRHHTDAP